MEANQTPKPEAKKVSTPKPQTPRAVASELTAGLYQSGSKEFYAKFPELQTLANRLDKQGYGFIRFEITCSPKKSPAKKLVNIIKHNAPDTWLRK